MARVKNNMSPEEIFRGALIRGNRVFRSTDDPMIQAQALEDMSRAREFYERTKE